MKKLYTFSVKNITNKFVFQKPSESNDSTETEVRAVEIKKIVEETSKELNDLSGEKKEQEIVIDEDDGGTEYLIRHDLFREYNEYNKKNPIKIDIIIDPILKERIFFFISNAIINIGMQK